MLFKIYNLLYNKLYNIRIVFNIYYYFRTVIPNYFERKRLRKYGYTDLACISNLFLNNGIIFFCDFGTLLGFIRDNSFIPHDTDIDMGIINNSSFSWDNIELLLRDYGIIRLHSYIYRNQIVEQTYRFPSGVTIDLFLYQIHDNYMRTYVFYKNHDIIYPSSKCRSVKALDYPVIDDFKSIVINDCCTIIPNNPEERLKAIYGNGWKKPDPNYKPDREDNIMLDFGFVE